jgi:uncharacterized membrane protein YfcA
MNLFSELIAFRANLIDCRNSTDRIRRDHATVAHPMLDPFVAIAGLFVGFVVGLTGMGGGALMTPVLVLLFGIEPLAAVSSDIVASMIMKPVGGAVHWRRGTVHKNLVLWLMVGSVPAAFLGVLLLKLFPSGPSMQAGVKLALGIALLAVGTGLLIRPLLQRRRIDHQSGGPIVSRPLATVLTGILGGLVVGIASVGSGSLIIMLLLIVYPRMRLSALVGTDLVQAIPLVASAALGHLLFGDFRLSLTASILIGSIPGVYIGARCSSRAPDRLIRPALIVVLVTSALKLFGLGTALVGSIAVALVITAVVHAVVTAQARARQHVVPIGKSIEPTS